MNPSRLYRLACFAEDSCGKPFTEVQKDFERLFIGDLIGGLRGFGSCEFDAKSRSMTFTISTVPEIEGGAGTVYIEPLIR